MSDHKLISILSASVEALEMSCAEAIVALAPWAGDLKDEDLLSPFLQEVKFVLNPVRPLYNVLGSLTRLGLGEFSVVSPLGFEPSLSHFH